MILGAWDIIDVVLKFIVIHTKYSAILSAISNEKEIACPYIHLFIANLLTLLMCTLDLGKLVISLKYVRYQKNVHKKLCTEMIFKYNVAMHFWNEIMEKFGGVWPNYLISKVFASKNFQIVPF